MKMLVLCLLTCLMAVCQTDSAISDCSVKCSSDCQCPCQSVNTKPLWKYTKMRGKGKNKKPVADPPVCLIPLETTSAADVSMEDNSVDFRCRNGVRILSQRRAAQEFPTTSTPSPPSAVPATGTPQ